MVPVIACIAVFPANVLSYHMDNYAIIGTRIWMSVPRNKSHITTNIPMGQPIGTMIIFELRWMS